MNFLSCLTYSNFLLRSIFYLVCCLFLQMQVISQSALVKKNDWGLYQLTDSGASYFALLSLGCVDRISPHMVEEYWKSSRQKDSVTSRDIWPSFYGCMDWHSSVHNHWCMVKLLKRFPNIPEATRMRERLDFALSAENIAQERLFFTRIKDSLFEFPYGQSWFLKLADELKNWKDPQAQKWLLQMRPLLKLIEANHLREWDRIDSVMIFGSHQSPAMGISFALDYARTFQHAELEKKLVKASRKYYLNRRSNRFLQEPLGFDFMSGTLLVCDLMRKVLPGIEYNRWLSVFCPELVDLKLVDEALKVRPTEIHEGVYAHWDGFHLNRIWCLTGIFCLIPPSDLSDPLGSKWVKAMNDMWDYAQQSIGKGNYDIDHWLSSFSVFALCGYDN
jgi:hypothetical protein